MLFRFVIFLSLISGSLSCSSDTEDKAGYNGQNNNNTNQNGTVSFSKDVYPILKGSCAASSCHAKDGAKSAVLNVSEFYDVKGKIDKILSVTSGGIMPPETSGKTPLTEEQISKLKQWKAGGFLL